MSKIVLILITLILFCSCQKTDSEIVAERQWKAGSLPFLGDWLKFSENKKGRLFISNDTIYKSGKAAAIIDSLDYEFDHYVLTIHSLDNKQSGKYFDKGREE